MIQQHYIIGNAVNVREIVSTKKNISPNLIISSPPYFDLLNYDNNKNQVGYGQKSYKDYLNLICKVFQECHDISKPNASFWLIVDTFKKNGNLKLFPFDIVNALIENAKKTWKLKDIIIWDKGKGLPWGNNGNFKNQHEYILFFTKSADFTFNVDNVREILDLKKWWKTYPERYNPDGKAPSNVWNFPAPLRGWGNNKQNHLCPFPFQLVEKIISIASNENDWILDPFAGSGSVLAIAKQMKRNSLGIDVNKSYKNRFKEEVIMGSDQYWSNRIKELDNANLLLKNFKSTNQKLRKLKVASNICERLIKVNNYPFVFYTRDKAKNDIDVIVLQNGKIPKINLVDSGLNELIKQSKINANVIIEKDFDFVEGLTSEKSYKYKLQTFYSYTSTCKMKKVLKNSDRYDYMYSDIGLKIFNN